MKTRSGQLKNRPFTARELWMFAVILIFACGTIITLAIAFGDHPHAAQDMDFAGMLISIALALVAIIYTIVDGGSQRHNVAQLNEAVESVRNLIDETQSQWENAANLSTTLGAMIQEQSELRNTLISELKQAIDTAQGPAREMLEQIQRKLPDSTKTAPVTLVRDPNGIYLGGHIKLTNNGTLVSGIGADGNRTFGPLSGRYIAQTEYESVTTEPISAREFASMIEDACVTLLGNPIGSADELKVRVVGNRVVVEIPITNVDHKEFLDRISRVNFEHFRFVRCSFKLIG